MGVVEALLRLMLNTSAEVRLELVSITSTEMLLELMLNTSAEVRLELMLLIAKEHASLVVGGCSENALACCLFTLFRTVGWCVGWLPGGLREKWKVVCVCACVCVWKCF